MHRFVPAQARIGLSGSTEKNPQRIVKGWEKPAFAERRAEKGLPGEWHRKVGYRFWEWEAPGFILSKEFQYSKLTTDPLKLLAG